MIYIKLVSVSVGAKTPHKTLNPLLKVLNTPKHMSYKQRVGGSLNYDAA